MRARVLFVLVALATVLFVGGPPWLALREARKQAYEIESRLALVYARDVLHRTDETFAQAQEAFAKVAAAAWPPCSSSLVTMMRKLDLESSYIQAVGHLRDGAMECSSIGGPPVPLGRVAFRTKRDITVYGSVPLYPDTHTPLLGLVHDDVVVLVHRDLPLDIWTAESNVSLASVHLEPYYVMMAHGNIDPRWLTRMGQNTTMTFVDENRMVAIVRSKRYMTTATIAAVPLVFLQQRIAENTRRLLPNGLFAGLAAATAIILLARRQMSMAAALRAALRRREFFLVYQPLVDLRTGAWVGAEALLRWRTGAGEQVGPEVFIPIAEQNKLITRLTLRVLELIEADAGAYLAAHPEFHIAINLSSADFRSREVVDHIDAMLDRTGAQPSSLMVEITERGLLDLDSARSVISMFRERGIDVAIDDFGTGYSSLSYLEALDLDLLKIDKSFIEAIGTRAPTSQVVRHIIPMARTLGLRIIAEGVESETQAEFLRAREVEYAQGWLFGKAMSFPDLVRHLDARVDQPALERTST